MAQNANRVNMRTAVASVIVLVIVMSLYAFVRLSESETVYNTTIVIFIILGIVRILIELRDSTKLETGVRAAFFVVALSIALGIYRNSLLTHLTFLFATIFYRPEYTRHGNRRLAFVLSLLIVGTVLPITLGVVTGRDVVGVLTLLYALLVAFLWIFCSKLGATVLGFESRTSDQASRT